MSLQLSSRVAVRGLLLGLAAVLVAPLALRAWDETPGPAALPRAQGLKGEEVALEAPEGGVSVVVFYSSECPISNAYSPTLNQIVDAFPAKSLKFTGLCVDFDLSDEDISAHAKDFGLKFPVARDRRGAIAARLGARVTPEAFVIDSKGRVRYRGRIDDQFAGRGKRNANSTTRELHDAIAAVLAGREVAREHVEAVGCPIPEPPKEKATATPTYFKDVAPDPPEALPGVPPQGTGGPLRARDLRAGPQACRRHRRRGRGPADAPVEADSRGRPEVQA